MRGPWMWFSYEHSSPLHRLFCIKVNLAIGKVNSEVTHQLHPEEINSICKGRGITLALWLGRVRCSVRGTQLDRQPREAFWWDGSLQRTCFRGKKPRGKSLFQKKVLLIEGSCCTWSEKNDVASLNWKRRSRTGVFRPQEWSVKQHC